MVAKPTGRGGGRRYDLSPTTKTIVAERGARLRVMGNNWRETTEQLRVEFPEVDIAETTVIAWVNAHIKPAAEQTVEDYRQQQLAEIEFAKKAIMKRVEKGDDKALASLDRLMARQAKLLGMDAPVSVQIEAKVVNDELEVQRMLSAMDATGQIIKGEVVQRELEG